MKDGKQKREGKDSFRNLWSTLGRTIYVGDRLENNLNALTAVSVFCMILGVVLIIMNLVQPVISASKVIMSVVTLLSGAGCAYLSHVRKNRNLAVMIPTIFCGTGISALTICSETSFATWSLYSAQLLSPFASTQSWQRQALKK